MASCKTCDGACFGFWQVSFGGLGVEGAGWVAMGGTAVGQRSGGGLVSRKIIRWGVACEAHSLEREDKGVDARLNGYYGCCHTGQFTTNGQHP